VESVLADGGMGRVWRARDVRLGRPVAVKVLRSEFTGDASFLSRFRAEARCAALLNHPHIAAVHDYGEAVATGSGEPMAYLVMELVDGEPLSDLLARRVRLDASETLRIVRQTADALAAAHAAGVVHRDVKPGNLLVTPDLDVKITDFGIAQFASSVPLTRTGQVIGTAQYLSPEQAAGGRATAASDVYALGVVAYECLSGRPPFDGEGPVQVALQQIRDVPPPLAPTVPEDVRRLVERAMAKDPAARFRDGAAVRDAIDELAVPRGPLAPDRRPTTVAGARSAPRTTVAPAPAPTAAAPTHRWAAPFAGRRGRNGRGLAVLLGAAATTLLVVLAVVAAVTGAAGGGVSSQRQPVGGPPAGAASHAPVQVRASDLVGRPLAAVQAQLTALGLEVQPRPVATGDVPAGQVIAVDPAGRVLPGQTLVVTYAAAPPDAAGKSDEHGHGHGDGD
jgi:serine/threonine-protein kinase